MSRLIWKILPVTLLMALGWNQKAILAQGVPSVASPAETLEFLQRRDQLKHINIPNANNPMSQVTNVNQLRDVAPTDWAYEALRSLVERYGCIVGYPDRTFRGDRALTRWEFAAGLNACLTQLERLIQEGVAVLREDIEKLRRLAQEFEAELAALGSRIDNLEDRVAFLEDHQFSTTTTLTGEVIFAISGIADGERNNGTEDIPRITTFGHRTRLEFNTSFTGEDLLYTRVATGTAPEYAETAETSQANLAFAQPEDSDTFVEVLYYTFPVTDNLALWLEANGGAFDDFTPTLNALDGDGAFGALSVFGTRNPIYYQGEGGGIGLDWTFGDFQLSGGYLASLKEDPLPGRGLFNGPFAALAQFAYVPSEDFQVAFIFNHGYKTLSSGTNSRLRGLDRLFGDELIDTVHDSYSLGFTWTITDNFILSGWGGYTDAKTLNSFEDPDDDFEGTINRGFLDIWNWAITMGFPDILREGSLAGIVIGQPPWVTSSDIQLADGSRLREDSPFHVEGFFQFPFSDNISITPGIIVVTSPDNDESNDALVIGVIRTTFTF
ncbi:Carbohydrate-selective porin OprB [Gloeothece citriformis PCC 7424]|uniref:Carbohydrate-selective porin OprB n=1 Tax=Gloeothece citriformis (strain PCC 7424) TaxID=65393 RepID=B7KH40_GLOC7|nr:iron uptake porin [Gloeothece citriformis]ACK69249.1 Carbohydrate-selective porin OprB [Gloeothece citriformis PCC 7424]